MKWSFLDRRETDVRPSKIGWYLGITVLFLSALLWIIVFLSFKYRHLVDLFPFMDATSSPILTADRLASLAIIVGFYSISTRNRKVIFIQSIVQIICTIALYILAWLLVLYHMEPRSSLDTFHIFFPSTLAIFYLTMCTPMNDFCSTKAKRVPKDGG